ncbi:MAG: radical SAM protein [Firmicutes bacterium]|jgi:MoaA/NifB/PqqE/SkfB family radical SAM enzyme|nr:radical SAM protein [Bacillota bacterium]
MDCGRAREYASRVALRQALRYLGKDPERKLGVLLDWAERLAVDPRHKEEVRCAKALLGDPGNNWRSLAVNLLTNTHPNVRERLGVNFFLNAGLIGIPAQYAAARRLGVSVPFALLIDPTERCNLRCVGCWAGEYEGLRDLDLDLMDRVVGEAEDLGIHFFVVSGGEPLIRADDLFTLARKHRESVFHVFTNGTLIDRETAGRVISLGNVTLAISLEGFKESTDARRGPGTFDMVVNAMDALRNEGAVFGFSVTYHRYNTAEVGGDEFVDFLVSSGCSFGWYFTYVPVGTDADPGFMASPEQRAFMFHQVRRFRKTKPIFIADFWNDGEFSGGCIAGGRRYLHINAAGEVEPCAFIHYSTCNIRDVSLVDALRSPLMRAYQKHQPFNHNMLRPCPLIDNPEMLEKIVRESGARPTQKNAGDVRSLCLPLRQYAADWGRISAELWERSRAGAEDAARALGR